MNSSTEDKLKNEAIAIKNESKNMLFNKNVLVGTALFGLLSPGILLTIPTESKGLWMSGQTSPKAVAVHAAIFAVTFAATRALFSSQFKK